MKFEKLIGKPKRKVGRNKAKLGKRPRESEGQVGEINYKIRGENVTG